MTNDVEALESLVTDSVVTLFQSGPDAGRRGRRAALPRRQAGAAHLLHRPADRRREPLVPAIVRRRVPAHARDDRLDHRLPAGDALGHPRRAQLRAGAATTRRASPSSTRTTARPTWSRCASTPPTFPAVEMLSGVATRADPARTAGYQAIVRPHHGRHGGRVRGDALLPLRTDPAALPALHHLPVRAWPPWRRSSSCSTPSPIPRTRPSERLAPIRGEIELRGRLLLLLAETGEPRARA